MTGVRGFLRVLRDRQLRRVELGMMAFAVCETATWLAITVFAFERGGVGEAGIVSFVQLAPASAAAPLAAFAADRFPRNRALAAGFLLQAVAFGLAGAALLADVIGIGNLGAGGARLQSVDAECDMLGVTTALQYPSGPAP